MTTLNKKPLKILLADDHLIVRQGLQFIIEEIYEDSTYFHASTLKKVLELLALDTFDVLILDAQFPDGISLSIISEVKIIQPEIKLLIFTSFEEEHYSLKFIEAGANGFLSKLSEEDVICSAIKAIVEEGQYYPVLTKKLLEITQYSAHFSNPLYHLSERELQIAKLLVEGLGNLEIANELNLKQNTISTFKKRIFEKLKIDSLIDLIKVMNIHHPQ